MEITAKMVADLRQMTGVGMMECKKALTQSNGDMDKAIKYLSEQYIVTCISSHTLYSFQSIVIGYAIYFVVFIYFLLFSMLLL